MKINAVTACWSSLSYQQAVQKIAEGTVEPILGQLSFDHVQLCPQHPDFISYELLDFLQEKYPSIQFRLHSDIRLINKRGITMDLVDFTPENLWYFKTIAEFSNYIKAPAYSLHAGVRKIILEQLFEKYYQLQDLFDCPIAIEGHYPFGNDKYLINSWSEYEAMFNAGINYALDLSHLNIVAHREGWQFDLTKEMLASSQCKEIHISFNEGKMDNHLIATNEQQELWNLFKSMIEQSSPSADIFSEGNQVLHLRKQKSNEPLQEITYMN